MFSWMIVSHVHVCTCIHVPDAWLGWQAPARDPSTNAPVADPTKFPNGVKDLADKIHAMGLKVPPSSPAFFLPFIRIPTVWNIQFCREVGVFYKNYHGLHILYWHRFTCGGRFGSLDFEEIDAKTYASWGIDYLSMSPIIPYLNTRNSSSAKLRIRQLFQRRSLRNPTYFLPAFQ